MAVYNETLITRQLVVTMASMSPDVDKLLASAFENEFGGRCVPEGFIRRGSVALISKSAATVKGSNVVFEVLIKCDICNPVVGNVLHCVAKNITKAGIRGKSRDVEPSPVDVFVLRDHHNTNAKFNDMKEGDEFDATVIGQRFELFDTQVSVIAELM